MSLLGRWLLLAVGLLCAARAGAAPATPPSPFEELPAAILGETNRERMARGIPPLEAHAKLARAADGHARFLALLGSLQHESLLPGNRTIGDRVSAAGVRPRFVGENLALTALQEVTLRSEPDAAGRLRVSVDKSATLRADEIAAKVVRQWMESPGHRANLLNREFTHLGCAVRPGAHPISGSLVYSVQVFARL